MADAEPGRSEADPEGRYVPMPRWVKFLLAVSALLAVLVLAVLFSGGSHGPGRHLGLAAAASSST